jgi:hypothetical protein
VDVALFVERVVNNSVIGWWIQVVKMEAVIRKFVRAILHCSRLN